MLQQYFKRFFKARRIFVGARAPVNGVFPLEFHSGAPEEGVC
jgi:hypothetical protein